MGYRIQSTGEYIATSTELRSRLVGQISPVAEITPELLKDLGVDPVLEGPQATGGTVYQYSQYSGLVKKNNNWYTKYILGPVFTSYVDMDGVAHSAEEQEAAYKAMKDTEQGKNVRQGRNQKLAESDWTQLADSPVDKAAWVIYRQSLRDVPSQTGFPWSVEWPKQPE